MFLIVYSLMCVCLTFSIRSTPPFSFYLIVIFGGSLLSLIPKPSSSFSIMILCMAGLVASRTMRIRLHVLATAIMALPLPLLSLAPSTIPGRSKSCTLAPFSLNIPGIQATVVNSHYATSDSVPVTLLRRVDFPTEGKPIRPILASPDLETSNPSPGPPFPLDKLSIYSLFNLASLALSKPRCPSVALFF